MKPIAFIHNPKCAGSSFKKYLALAQGASTALHWHRVPNPPKPTDAFQYSLYCNLVDAAVGDLFFKRACFFRKTVEVDSHSYHLTTVVRHPYDRAISAFMYLYPRDWKFREVFNQNKSIKFITYFSTIRKIVYFFDQLSDYFQNEMTEEKKLNAIKKFGKNTVFHLNPFSNNLLGEDGKSLIDFHFEVNQINDVKNQIASTLDIKIKDSLKKSQERFSPEYLDLRQRARSKVEPRILSIYDKDFDLYERLNFSEEIHRFFDQFSK